MKGEDQIRLLIMAIDENIVVKSKLAIDPDDFLEPRSCNEVFSCECNHARIRFGFHQGRIIRSW